MNKIALIFFLLSCVHNTKKSYSPTYISPYNKSAKATSNKLMISSQGEYSSLAAKEVYTMGGNIVDAAIALSFAISVERPQSTGIGGGGFMLISLKEMSEPISIDFREMAPLGAHDRMYLDEKGKEIPRKSLDGIFAVGTPGLIAGLVEAHKKYGKLPLSKIVAPAARLARSGFKVYPGLEKALEHRKEVLAKYPATKKIFFKGNEPLKAGDLLVQKDLAKTLEKIGKEGRKGFYSGSIGKAIVAESKRLNGLITQKDLDGYVVKFRDPVKGTYKGHEVYSMAPPSSGGTHIVQILNILEGDDLKSLGPHHPKSIHLTASAMQIAFADRSKYLGDPDYSKVPVKELVSKKYAKERRFDISETIAVRSRFLDPGKLVPYESDETTHFSLMDSEGNTVVSTQTINGWMGSGVVVPGTGIVLNNEMDDFATKVGASNLFGAIGGKKNLVAPNKRPLSSMSPTIVRKNGENILALGSPAGTKILTCVAQVVLNVIEYDLDLYSAMTLTRYHHQWKPDKLFVEPPGFADETMKDLSKREHFVEERRLGCRVQAIKRNGNSLLGVSDPRGEGSSIGL